MTSLVVVYLAHEQTILIEQTTVTPLADDNSQNTYSSAKYPLNTVIISLLFIISVLLSYPDVCVTFLVRSLGIMGREV